MCLVVKQKWHNKRKPLIAEEDFVVFKVLRSQIPIGNDVRLISNESGIFTPFVTTRIRFMKGGKITMRSNIVIRTNYAAGPFYGESYCYEGIHACLIVSKARSFCYYDNRFVVKAIIPKGAEYFIGEYNDIVANEMIVTNQRV